MGLMIHSLGELPADVDRDYYVYLLDYGWHEPLGEVLDRNFERMAAVASTNNAVVLKGVVGSHFVSEVLSWHSVNGQPAEGLLPAILITCQNPHDFQRPQAESIPDKPMLIIPLRDHCKNTQDVAKLIDNLFKDIQEKNELQKFKIASEMNKGKSGALVDALILEPNIAGVGLDFKKLGKFLKSFVTGTANSYMPKIVK